MDVWALDEQSASIGIHPFMEDQKKVQARWLMSHKPRMYWL